MLIILKIVPYIAFRPTCLLNGAIGAFLFHWGSPLQCLHILSASFEMP